MEREKRIMLSIRLMTELSLVRAIPTTLREMPEKNTKLYGMFTDLIQLVDKNLSCMSTPSGYKDNSEFYLSNKELIKKLYREFGSIAGFLYEGKTVSKICYFMIEMLEKSEITYSRSITEVLKDIMDHTEKIDPVTESDKKECDETLKKWLEFDFESLFKRNYENVKE